MKSEVFNIDCMKGMKNYPDNYFDLTVVDPPYGINRDKQNKTICKNPKHNRKQLMGGNWDISPKKEYFVDLSRISKNQIIWGANYFVEYLSSPSMGWIVWYKGQQGLNMSDCELAYSNFSTPTRVFILNRFVLNGENTFHPTQKPVKLYEWIFKNYAEEGMKILDTHLGSGSSRISAYNYGMDFTGYEIDKDYFEVAEKRFQNHVKSNVYKNDIWEKAKVEEKQTKLFS